MKRSRYTEAHILAILRQGEGGDPVEIAPALLSSFQPADGRAMNAKIAGKVGLAAPLPKLSENLISFLRPQLLHRFTEAAHCCCVCNAHILQ